MAPEHDKIPTDARLFFPNSEGWKAAIKQDWSKEYCFLQNPGENFYHLLMNGEIYIQRGTERFCLACAIRHGYVTRDRAFWQKGPSSVTETTWDGPPSER